MCFGSDTQTSTTTTKPGPSGIAEQNLLGTSKSILDMMLAQLGYTLTPGEVTAGKKGQQPITNYSLTKTPLTPEQQAQADFEAKLKSQYQNELLTGNISPEARAQLDEFYNTAGANTQRDITTAATSAAARRGLNLTDTPIGDPYLRATGQASANINAERARGYLGLRGDELNRAFGLMGYQDTQNQLKNFQNPYALANMYSNIGLGMQGNRYKVGTSTTTGPAPATNWGGLMQGAGGLMSGASQVPWGAIGTGIAGLFSSETLKDDLIELSPDDYEEVLDAVKDTPVFTWKYKPGLGLDDERTHLGPTVEHSPRQMRSKNGLALDTIDYMGTMMTAVKGLAKKVEKLSATKTLADASFGAEEERGLGLV